MTDVVEFLDFLTETETDFNHIFHLTENNENPIQVLKTPQIDKKRYQSILQKAKKRINEKEFADHHELETDYSHELSDLKPKATTESEIQLSQIRQGKPEEVIPLFMILEISVENVIETGFSSEIIKQRDFLWTINKMKLF